MFYRHTTLVLLIGLTTLYLLLNVFTGNILLPNNLIAAFIGLFVPAGVWSTIASRAMVPALAIVGSVYLDRYLVTKKFSLAGHIFIALVTLFIATLVSDLVLWQNWNSMYFFLEPFGIEIPHSKMQV